MQVGGGGAWSPMGGETLVWLDGLHYLDTLGRGTSPPTGTLIRDRWTWQEKQEQNKHLPGEVGDIPKGCVNIGPIPQNPHESPLFGLWLGAVCTRLEVGHFGLCRLW